MTTQDNMPTPAQTPSPAIPKRPITFLVAIGLLVLLAGLAMASPFLSRGGGFSPTGQRTPPPGGWQPGGGDGTSGGDAQRNNNAGGQFPDDGGAPPGDPGGQFQNDGNASGGANGQFPTGRRGGGMGGFGFMQWLTPVRIGLGVAGGLLALMAALGLWRQKRWGMVLALLVAGFSLLAAAASLLMPVLGRSLRGMFSIGMVFVMAPTWQAMLSSLVAVAVAVLVLLPVSQRAYVTVPKARKERRVM